MVRFRALGASTEMLSVNGSVHGDVDLVLVKLIALLLWDNAFLHCKGLSLMLV